MKSIVPFPVDCHILELAKSKLKLRHKFAKPTMLYVEQQPRLASPRVYLQVALSSTIPLSLSLSPTRFVFDDSSGCHLIDLFLPAPSLPLLRVCSLSSTCCCSLFASFCYFASHSHAHSLTWSSSLCGNFSTSEPKQVSAALFINAAPTRSQLTMTDTFERRRRCCRRCPMMTLLNSNTRAYSIKFKYTHI